MVYMLGMLITALVWLFKGSRTMKDSYTSGREDFLNMIKGDEDANNK